MYDKLPINTDNNSNANPGVFSATFQYTEDPSLRKAATIDQTTAEHYGIANRSSSTRRAQSTSMSGQPSTAAPTGMYVRALYDYEADDRTSLSFRQGDTIQVLNQLASGWWDGIINGVRGWFPSNYCAVVTGPDDANARGAQPSTNGGHAPHESVSEDEYEEYNEASDTNELSRDAASVSGHGGDEDREQEEAAFWIPQVTPDGRLFYFNTLTGVSTMELPLETPTSVNEQGPRDRMNINVPDQTRPPPEMMAGGIEREDSESEFSEGTSASELDDSQMLPSRGQPRQRRSYISDGASPAGSTDSLNASPLLRNRKDPTEFEYGNMSTSAVQQVSASMSAIGSAANSFTSNPLGQISAAAIPNSFFDDGNTDVTTWNKLVDNMRRSVELYGQAINNADRSEYVRRAEDISDHLRMLLAAASGTTDNHSGNPSIISTNKPLYPHFRDMMSRFSKLVLSSHIAAADFPAPDSYSKCLQEAEGVLNGVYGYVEVARSQRGEEIPRLVPGFILGSNSGGGWQNNNLETRDSMLSTSFMDQDDEQAVEPTTPLDANLLERMDDLKSMIVSSIRRLEEHLTITDKLITPYTHKKLGVAVCGAAGKVLDFFRPWISTVESIDLGQFRSQFQHPQLNDFGAQKQRVYDIIMQLMVSCQSVAAPLGDEWAESRGDPLEDRLNDVHAIAKQLEICVSQVGYVMQLLMDFVPQDSATLQQLRDAQAENPSQSNTDAGTGSGSGLANTGKYLQRPHLADMDRSQSFTAGIDTPAENYRNKGNSKVKKFFGEVPTPMLPGGEMDTTPSFLRLDLEGEISYDEKVQPPQLRGGTLAALVEQLTRHDRLDSAFNTTFLITYKSFTTASELFELLVKRFSIQPPRGISEEDCKTWVDKKQKPIRMRVVNILKSWFDNYWMEHNDAASNQLLRRVYSFAKDSIATTHTPGFAPLMNAVEQRMRGQDTNAKKMVPTPSVAAPTPIMPKNMKKLKFLDIDATEFARQLTIIEAKLYGKIKPTECLGKMWSKKVAPGEPEPAANVKALIYHSNQLTNWVAEMILTQADVKKRVIVIKHFISIADVSTSPSRCLFL